MLRLGATGWTVLGIVLLVIAGMGGSERLGQYAVGALCIGFALYFVRWLHDRISPTIGTYSSQIRTFLLLAIVAAVVFLILAIGVTQRARVP